MEEINSDLYQLNIFEENKYNFIRFALNYYYGLKE